MIERPGTACLPRAETMQPKCAAGARDPEPPWACALCGGLERQRIGGACSYTTARRAGPAPETLLSCPPNVWEAPRHLPNLLKQTFVCTISSRA